MSTQEKSAAQSTGALFTRLLAQPLYSPVVLTDESSELRNLRMYTPTFDMYCPDCRRHSTFNRFPDAEAQRFANTEKLSALTTNGGMRVNWLGAFTINIACVRSGSHMATYLFRVTSKPVQADSPDEMPNVVSKIIKYGQYPSLTDFQIGDLAEFEDALTLEQRKEFMQAINTAAHGFSVAACVYYRRVFENILRVARDEHMVEAKLDAWPEFERARTDERIRLLADKLPAFLSENPHLYGILSLGVHELSEAECARELPMLRQAIELILRDRLNLLRERKQREDVTKLLAQAADRLKGR